MNTLGDISPETELYIGLMSGTSADGIDAALLAIDESQCQLLAHHSVAFDAHLRSQIHALCSGPNTNEIEAAGAMDSHLGELFAEAANTLLSQCQLAPQRISAIGSHGQTIRHRPPGSNPQPFSWQIGDPNIIAARTGITTVADFRRRDIAEGGQGAPLVPAFHAAVFAHPQHNRAIVNLGGIGNISWLAAGAQTLGFDTGPGNNLMDGWILRHRGLAYDANGEWGASAEANPELLAQLLKHPYLSLPIPKSTGREDFHLGWLDVQLENFTTLQPAQVQATLALFTAETIARHITQCPKADAGGELYLCGGGAHNALLKQHIASLLPRFSVESTAELGIDPDWVEAAAFAWLAQRRLKGLPGNLPSATGARRAAPLGAVYPA
ncbi:anhydro-N-acetylmuramic acid kinase [Gilvimarinus agarilyticus]|uniref:anhydro-N-acetylmuramic acid kinase n=1 Tax=Gilvimarinus agarilyticus TaxID=679259 RepID=UPI000698A803|nr:anhydro-N-acetylmuramic acid kinase [Gilvimarinus agarilyticus]